MKQNYTKYLVGMTLDDLVQLYISCSCQLATTSASEELAYHSSCSNITLLTAALKDQDSYYASDHNMALLFTNSLKSYNCSRK